MQFVDKIFRGIERVSCALKAGATVSFSQTGEDLILDSLFRWLSVPSPRYLDIGAYHPTRLSNTYLFYRRGSRGVCVDPNPVACDQIRRSRVRDVCLNVGVSGTRSGTLDFFLLDPPYLSTFSKEEVERIRGEGKCKIRDVLPIKVLSINELLETHFRDCLQLVSLDVEGLDYEIVSAWDFSRYRPHALCIETVTYSSQGKGRKLNELIDLMNARDYVVYAETFINTIFLDRHVFEARRA